MTRGRVLAAAAALATATVVAAATTAIGATDDDVDERLDLTSRIAISPKKLGTRARPRPIEASGELSLTAASPETDRPLLVSGTLLLPRGLRLRRWRTPTCEKAVLNRHGPQGCPRRSIIGRPVAAFAPPDGYSRPDVLFVNGGPRTIWAYITAYDPAFVQEVAEIRVRALRHRRWAYRLRFTVPRILIVLADVPVPFKSVRFHLGSGPGRVPSYLTSAGRCPKRGLPYRFTARFLLDDGSRPIKRHRGRIPCR